MRTPRHRIRFLVPALWVTLSWVAGASPAWADNCCDQIRCGTTMVLPQGCANAQACTTLGAASSVCDAMKCLEGASAFMNDAKGRIISGGATFEEVLPASYVVPQSSDLSSFAFNEGYVNGVIAWTTARIAANGDDRCTAEQLLVEAAFRKASAHGMFGDDRLLRALNPQFVRGLTQNTNDPQAAPLVLLDSRACKNSADPGASTGKLCNTDADCPMISQAPLVETCEACRFAGDYTCQFDDYPNQPTCNVCNKDIDCGVNGSTCGVNHKCSSADHTDCPRVPLISSSGECASPADCSGGVCVAVTFTDDTGKSQTAHRCHETCAVCPGAPNPTDYYCSSDCQKGSSNNQRAYGAMQEYRRAEQALADAANVLGSDRFRTADAVSGCSGGCAGALLLRMGSSKIRAQALRLDLLWSRAMTIGWPPPAATCQNPKAALNKMRCNLDSDCDQPGETGRCAADGTAERAFVMLRQAADEAFSEAGAAQSVYNDLINPQVLATSADLNLMRGQMGQMNEVINRAVSGITPFGLPADYVPYLTSVQQSYLSCYDYSTTNSQGKPWSIADCFLHLAEGDGKLSGVFKTAYDLQQTAYQSTDAMATAMKDVVTTRKNINDQLEDLGRRMFGLPCGADQCSCTDANFQSGVCVKFTKADGVTQLVWKIAGLSCAAGQGDPAQGICDSVKDADGDVELALQTIHSKRLVVDGLEKQIDRIEETRTETFKEFARRLAAKETECTEVVDAINDAGTKIAGLTRDKKKTGWERFGEAALTYAKGAGQAMAQSTDVVDIATLGITKGVEEAGVAVQTGAELGMNELHTEIETRRFEIDAKIQEAQTEKERKIQQAQCKSSKEILDIDKDDAIWKLDTDRQALEQQESEREEDVFTALGQLRQLFDETVRKRQQIEEASMIERIWGQENSFRNPQNYRVLAVQDQLASREAFRTAQQVTWMLLRSVAYDLVQADFSAGSRLLPSTLNIPSCRALRCSNTKGKCATDPDCTGGATDRCVIGSEPAPISQLVKDSSNQTVPTCSLQAVFAARTVEELRSLIQDAILQRARPAITLACDNTQLCQKTISLSRIFSDPTSGAPQSFGSVLQQLKTENRLKSFDFAITPQRGYQVCPQLPSDSAPNCQPLGVAGLSVDYDVFEGKTIGSGPANWNDMDNVWGQKFYSLLSKVKYKFGEDPSGQYCRDSQTGRVVNALVPCPSTTLCNAACPRGRSCVCRIIAGNSAVSATLSQIEPGVLRTRAAKKYLDRPENEDSLISYVIRKGDLFTEARNLTPFSVAFNIAPSEAQMSPEDDVRGVPVASPRWNVKLKSSATNAQFDDAFFEAIDDIELTLRFQAFDVD